MQNPNTDQNMAEKICINLYICFLSLFVALLPHCLCKSSESRGFSLKLVRRDFLDNPPFSLSFNFTSKAIDTELADHYPDMLRPPLTRSGFLFTIDATIGTPRRKRTFIFDTGSGLTWTQCTPCARCFKQDYPLFDPRKSSSYQKLPPNHALARFFNRSNNGECIFNVTYESGQSSAGIASVETLSLASKSKVPESIKGFVFGCSNSHQGQFTSNTLVTGIMGMNRSPLSVISQMGSKSVRRFSYCLPRLDSRIKSTFLRFGDDIVARGTFQETGFLRARDDYKVKLLDISVAGRLLKLPNGTFSNGCILDVGSAVSRLEMGAHIPVLYALIKHFDKYNLTRLRGDPSTQGDLCYRLKRGFRNYPSMTLHFQGANLEIGPENLFHFRNDRFCLALFGSKRLTLLGAYQQQNVRLIYDIGDEKLLFAKQDCSKDKA